MAKQWLAGRLRKAGVAILSATIDESTWVLTSYLVANAIILPMTGWLAGHFGRKRLLMTSVAQNYDFFTYSLTLFQTPMLLLSGVYFPVDQMPAALRTVAAALPLSHAIDIARPLLDGRVPADLALHLLVLLVYAIVPFSAALVLMRRRLLR